MYEEKQMFGRCPVCDAIVSLDPQRNVLCDRCYQDRERVNANFDLYWTRYESILKSRGNQCRR